MSPASQRHCLWKIKPIALKDALLSQGGNNFVYIPTLKSARAALEEGDRKYIHWEQVSSRERFAALTPDINWLKLWDDARDHGLPGTRALEATLRILMTPKYENYSCYICGHKPYSSQFPADHIAKIHLGCSADQLQKSLTDPSEEAFTLAASLRTKFHRPSRIIHKYLLFAYYFVCYIYILCWSRSNELF